MVYRGQMKGGVVVLEGRGAPPDGARVSVRVLKPRPPRTAKSPERTLYDRLKNVIGKAKGMPPDASRNLDHYLYGMPKHHFEQARAKALLR